MSVFRSLLALTAEGDQNYYPDYEPLIGIDRNTLLMLHGNGYVDVSAYNHTIDYSNTSIVERGAKFNSAFYSEGEQTSSHYIHTTLKEPLGTTYTVDFWFKPTSYSPTYGAFFTIGTVQEEGIYLQLIQSDDKIDAYIGGEQNMTVPLTENIPLNVWTHWAIIGTDSETKIYLNGTAIMTFGSHTLNQTEVYLFKSAQYGRSVPGYFEEVRISNIARWTEDFIPPDRPYSSSSTNLPAGYTPLEYIRSTGTQYINTGIAPTVDLEVDMVASFQGNQDSSWDCMLHAGNGDMTSGTYGLRLFGDSYHLQVCYSMYGSGGSTSSSYNNPTVSIVPNQVYTIRTTNQTLTLDGVTTTGTPSPINFTPVSYPMYLFAGNSSGSMWRRVRATLYSLRLTVGGEIVRDFIPALNPENVPGLYDTVSQTFFTNIGTGTFDYKLLPQEGLPSGLPSGYTSLKYLASSGTQYINTGVAPDTIETKVEIQYQYTGNKGTGFDSIIGSRSGGNMNARFYPSSCNGTSAVRHILGATVLQTTYDTNSVHTVLFNMADRSCFVDNVNIGNLGTSFAPHSQPMYMFGLNCEGNLSYASLSRIYYCKIWKNNALIRHFVPCLDSNSRPGFYDLVEGVFYTNAGSGTFTYA